MKEYKNVPKKTSIYALSGFLLSILAVVFGTLYVLHWLSILGLSKFNAVYLPIGTILLIGMIGIAFGFLSLMNIKDAGRMKKQTCFSLIAIMLGVLGILPALTMGSFTFFSTVARFIEYLLS